MSRLLSNLRAGALEQVIAATGILVTTYFIRYLGPEQYGIYQYYVGLSGMLSTFVLLAGIDQLLMRDISSTGQIEEIIAAGMCIKTVGYGLLVTSLTLHELVTKPVPYPSHLYIFLMALSGLNFIRDMMRNALIATQQIVLNAKINVILFAVNTIARVGGILIGADLSYFYATIVFDTVISTLIIHHYYRKRWALRVIWDRELILYLLHRGWPLIVTAGCVVIFMRIDQLMLLHMHSPSEAGLYGSMIWISERFLFVVYLLMTSLFPYLVEKYKSDRDWFNYVVRLAHKVLGLITIPLCLGISIFSKEIILVAFGEHFSSAATVLRIIVWQLVFIFWGAVNQKVLLIQDRLRTDLSFALSSALVNVLLNLLLIPTHGAAGASISTVIAHGFYFYAQFFIPSMRIYNYYMIRSLGVPIILSLVAIAGAYTLSQNSYAQMMIYYAIYFICIMVIALTSFFPDYADLRRFFIGSFRSRL